jgi:hypothetical protein
MSWLFKLADALGVNIAKVASDGTVQVAPSTVTAAGTPSTSGGYLTTVLEADGGNVTGARTLRQLDASLDYRARVGIDTIVFDEEFIGTALNTATFKYAVTTFAIAVAGGFATLNSASGTAASSVAILSTCRSFPNYSNYASDVEWHAIYKAASFQTGCVVEIGIGYAPTSVSAPTDGAYFRYDGAVLTCVINISGSETVSANLTPPSINACHNYEILITHDAVEFWIDDILQARLSAAGAVGSSTASQNEPAFVRQYYKVGYAGTAVQVNIPRVTGAINDPGNGRAWNATMVGMGGMAIQGQTAGTMGSTTNWANSAAPTAAVLANSAASYTTLGGQFLISAIPASAETDYLLFGYTVPAGSATVPGKSLYIDGVWISTLITTALGATGGGLHWFAAVGGTSANLALTETAAGGTKSFRRLGLGSQAFASSAVAGISLNDLSRPMTTPLIAHPGEVFGVGFKLPLGGSNTGTVRGSVGVTGWWE